MDVSMAWSCMEWLKKFNLDGPDGWQYYRHDLRKDKIMYSKRQQWGGSIMIWAAFGWDGKTDIAYISGLMDASGYQNLQEEYLLGNCEHVGGPNWLFQQDNATVHTTNSTYEWFLSNGVHWPPCASDLNPIEILWTQLARTSMKVESNTTPYQNWRIQFFITGRKLHMRLWKH